MIRIQNIYYMLSYTFQVLEEDRYRNVSSEYFEYATDLLAAILAKGVTGQIKRGLGREYILCEGILNTPRGKINISSSLKERTIQKRQLVCKFDELSENVYVNQIIKTTALLLINSNEVNPKRKSSLKKAMHYFLHINILQPQSIKWTNIKYHRNNSTYKMLMNICYLVIEALLPTTRNGLRKLMHYKEGSLHRLFEKFILAYYKKHYPAFKVSSSCINWNIDDGQSDFLPIMKTDVLLEYNEKSLIIDTKFYNKILQENNLYNSNSIRSNHLYQIYSYVKNKDINHSGNVSGLLLYAKTDEEFIPNNNYLIDGNRISVKTLDLNREFIHIRNQLNNIVEEWINRA